ncbi:MAG: aminopeptidase P family protein [Parasphingorhabdus sp.]|nr:aminopeptidase P family protein [Parasphingorhabdus sp.]
MQTHENRLAALREQMKKDGLDGFVIPISDEHMSEYVGDYAQRLGWISGFGGSAGTVVVMADKAAIFVDGRYDVQVGQQVDARLFEFVSIAKQKVSEWLGANAEADMKIGYDAWLHTQEWAQAMAKALTKKGAELVPVATNPIDKIWADQPERSLAKLAVQPDEYSGRSAAQKRADTAEWLRSEGYDATVIAALDSVAWFMNIRGGDIANTPVALAYAIAHADERVTLFVAPEKLTDEVRAHLGNAVELRDYVDFSAGLAELAGKIVAVDPEYSVAAIAQSLTEAGATVVADRDPTRLARAIKNDVEAEGIKAAHVRDGAALTKFLRWMANEAPKGGVDELSAAARLKAFRQELPELKDLSFRTISAAGPNGALPHYSVNAETNRPVENNSLYLVDSGGQYLDGTTDVTRVVAVGTPTAEMRKRYTQVLQGHIALDMAVFPDGTCGGALDVLARQYLWADGVDYGHGTGHGVGAYLSVHEGPQRIGMSAGVQTGTGEPLRAGMVLSNEPGYYKVGEFGIRIENLVLVVKREIAGAEKEMLGFETLTFAPLERKLIDAAMLSPQQRGWVDDYHAKVLGKVGPQLAGEELEWLKAQCAPL